MGGKFLISQYLAHSNAGGSYGPAGAFVVLLLWVYYSALTFYLGAEIVAQRMIATLAPEPLSPEIPVATTQEAAAKR